MAEANIPGMAFRARLAKKEGKNVVELIFKGEVVTSIDLGEQVTESSLLSGLKKACKENEIEHQVPQALLAQVAGDLYKQAGLDKGKELVSEKRDTAEEDSDIERSLVVIISSLQKINNRLDKIESLLQTKTSE